MKSQKENIKKALEQATPEWDDKLVWKAIEEDLHPKKDRKYFLFILTGAFVIILGSITSIYTHKSVIVESVSTKAAKNTGSIVNNHSTNESHSNKINFQQEKREQQIHLETSSSTLLQEPAELIKTDDEKPTIFYSNSNQQTKVKSANRTDLASQHLMDNFPSHSTSPSITAVAVNSAINPKPNTAIEIDKISSNIPLRLTPNENYSNPKLRLQKFVNTKTATTIPIHKIKLNQLAFKASLYNTFRQLSGPANDDWIETKNLMDATLETVAFSVSWRQQLSGKFFISLGLGIRQTIEMMTSMDELVSYREVFSPNATIIINSFQALYLSGDLTETTTQKRTTITPNRHQALYTPFSIGYQKQFQKWGFEITTGVDVNLASQFRGKILRYDGSVILYNSVEQDYFKNNISLSNINLETAVRYRISQKMTLLAGTSFKYAIHDHLIAENYEQSYNLLGLSISALYQL